jgi:hypothetical protein
MTTINKEIQEFVQETLKINGLIAAEQLSALATQAFGEKGEVLNIPQDKKEHFTELLNELNKELTAAREAHEAYTEEAEGYKTLTKPFTNIFNYISENMHSNRAKELATEAAKLFLKTEATQLIKAAFTEEGAKKIKNLASAAKDKLSNTAHDAKKKTHKLKELA